MPRRASERQQFGELRKVYHTLFPALHLLPASAPAPSVAGHPATDNQHRHPLNNKKSGPDSVKSEKTACTQGKYSLK